MSRVRKSYLKTTAGCLALVAVALLAAVLALYRLPAVVGAIVAILAVLGAFAAGTFACGGGLVLYRHKRDAVGERDLFLELNRSRNARAIESGSLRGVTFLRRRLARRLLGHDFVVGDLVEIKSWREIRATLDEHGCLDELPFMPEMLAMCGRRAYVFRCMHRLFDYRKTRKMRHMEGTLLLAGAVCDGSSHGGCEAACHTIWKSAWLRRVERHERAAGPAASGHAEPVTGLLSGSREHGYVCQLTQLHAASRPTGTWSLLNFIRPLVSGNVAPAAFVVGWLTALFNDLQHLRGGISYPVFDTAGSGELQHAELPLRPGDEVIVRSPAEIRATLNDRLIHRGMGFETDMLKHCGRRCSVQAEVRKLIDIVTGEMRTMKTPAYILRGVHFSGERQLFNAQYEPLFWRSVWLRKCDDRAAAAASEHTSCSRGTGSPAPV